MAEDGEIFLETRRIGGAVRVAAVCASTGLEVVFAAPAETSEAGLAHLAQAKLAFARNRGVAPDPARRGPRRGVIV